MLNAADLISYEDQLYSSEDSVSKDIAIRLLGEVYHLNHELSNPWYMYAGARIQRAAFLHREQTINKLRKEIEELKANHETVVT